jgi:hypothetical protein
LRQLVLGEAKLSLHLFNPQQETRIDSGAAPSAKASKPAAAAATSAFLCQTCAVNHEHQPDHCQNCRNVGTEHFIALSNGTSNRTQLCETREAS